MSPQWRPEFGFQAFRPAKKRQVLEAVLARQGAFGARMRSKTAIFLEEMDAMDAKRAAGSEAPWTTDVILHYAYMERTERNRARCTDTEHATMQAASLS